MILGVEGTLRAACEPSLMRSRGLGGLLIATIVGVGSGYYIFQPIMQQSAEKARTEAAAKTAKDASEAARK